MKSLFFAYLFALSSCSYLTPSPDAPVDHQLEWKSLGMVGDTKAVLWRAYDNQAKTWIYWTEHTPTPVVVVKDGK